MKIKSIQFEGLKLSIAGLLSISAIFAFNALSARGALTQWSALLLPIALSMLVFITSQAGKWFCSYVADSWREAIKVVWPSKTHTLHTSLFVFGFVAIVALFLWCTDKSLEWLIYDRLLQWKK